MRYVVVCWMNEFNKYSRAVWDSGPWGRNTCRQKRLEALGYATDRGRGMKEFNAYICCTNDPLVEADTLWEKDKNRFKVINKV